MSYAATNLTTLALMQLLTNLPPLQHGDLGLTFIGHSSIFGRRQIFNRGYAVHALRQAV